MSHVAHTSRILGTTATTNGDSSAAAVDRRCRRETTGSPLRTQTQYKRTLGEEPAGPRLAAGPDFDCCIKAPIRNNSATPAMSLWKIA
jgi:hypothetical protein